MNKKYNTIIITSAIISIALTIFGCKKYDNPPPIFEELSTNTAKQRKVLVISIDGVSGDDMKTIAPPNITELKKTSKYSYNVLKGAFANDVSSWVSMLNGVSYSKHLIIDNTFESNIIIDDNGHEAVKSYRNVIDYVLQYKALKTAFVTTWPELRQYIRVADYTPIVATDVEVKDSTVNLLKQNNLGTLYVNFRETELAGINGGFAPTNSNYKNKVLKSDEYVGEILKSLKARSNYANEDWLVIVTTNHGGSSDDPKNGFLIASQQNLKEQELKSTGFNTILFNNASTKIAVASDKGLYDSGTNNDFTVQVQVKFNSNVIYPGFISKGTDLLNNVMTGWLFYYGDGGNWSSAVGGASNGGTTIKTSGGTGLGDFKWHTLTMTVKTINATTRTLTNYTDGIQGGTANIAASKDLTNIQQLSVGYRSTGTPLPPNFQAADLSYFNVALDANTIKNNLGIKDITKHPNYSNLTGYWPINEGGEGVIGNRAPGGYDMYASGAFSWKSMGTDVPLSMTPDPNANSGVSVTVTNSTVPALVLYWLNINILPEFGFDGQPFLNIFETEFLK